ncbi:uncharacterized protein DSM5745_00953 [Aspergillus mulundensis]|uniref:Uncharacterized protein n=1 Tax=Aspergillus mulundensis TaxID=1810919 RepID=A0A3D8T5C1_9EURO|nr:hypothetical protein DSM5745_00953 [Aspergillus mulundensis]RDW93631.1 hypothetical protein DSM5745_00953 [Aspergillus mulundensis]
MDTNHPAPGPKIHLLTSICLASGLIFNTISLALGATALSDYLNQRTYLLRLVPKASIHDIAYVGALSYDIACCTFSVFALPTALLLLCIHRRQHTLRARRLLIACVVLALPSILSLANALALTVITATGSVSFGDSVGPRVTAYLDAEADGHGTPVLYRRDAVAIGTVVFSWLGWGCLFVGCVVLVNIWKSATGAQRALGFEGDKLSWPEDGSSTS